MKFRKKPVVVDAVQLTWESVLASSPEGVKLPEWVTESPDVSLHLTHKIVGSQFAIVKTLEGNMTAKANDWLIKGVNGEIYPCKPDIFEKTYERVLNDSHETTHSAK